MVIETERLVLRPLTLDDFDALCELQAVPDVARFMGAYDRGEMLDWLRSNQAEWAQRGHGRAAIVERSSGLLIGRAGLRYWPQFDETELGWALNVDGRGRGFATEAARAWLDWGFCNLTGDYFTAMVHPQNDPAIAVAKRLGMRPVRTDVLMGEPAIAYAAGRPETRPSAAAPAR